MMVPTLVGPGRWNVLFAVADLDESDEWDPMNDGPYTDGSSHDKTGPAIFPDLFC